MSTFINILLLLLVISILTFVHELGHFLAAKIVKAKVFDFSVGFGPKLISKKHKDTEYNLRALPFGGFVKILGDGDPTKDSEDTKDSGNLQNKSKLAQIFVMLAGVLMNFILAAVFYYIFLANSGWKMELNPDYTDFAPFGASIVEERVSDIPYQLTEDSPARESGIYEKGFITSVNGSLIENYENLTELIGNFKDQTVKINACKEDNSGCKDFQVKVSSDGKIGVYVGYNYRTYLDYSDTKFTAGFAHSVNMVSLTGIALSSIFREARQTGDYSQLSNSVSGPVGIYFIIDYFKTLGVPVFLGIVADLSVSLAIINLFPLPVLDGGRAFILLIESIARKDLNENVKNWIINASFVFLMLLIVAIMFKDIFNIKELQSLFK